MSETRLWKWFSTYIRLRDAQPFTGLATCFTCGRVAHWRQMDCGHGIPRQHRATKYNECNNHAQCKRCNAFEGGRLDEYAKQVDARYGRGTWDRLKIESTRSCKRTRHEIEIMTNYYKSEALKLAKQKHYFNSTLVRLTSVNLVISILLFELFWPFFFSLKHLFVVSL